VELSEYLLETLREDDEFVLYRGKCSNQPGSPTVLLLAPASMQPALETLRKIEYEYSFRDELDSAWAVRSLALSEYRGQMMLVLEDPGGETLDRFLPGPMEMTRFLRFAVGTAAALSGLHAKELLHKDVKPANVLINTETGHARLMGFGIASRLPRERQAPEPPEFIAGTLAYMAPEQTGRMNRSIDSRSDLYALGVTLYEMVTGTLPFKTSDPMELVHSHIARQPVPPGERLNGIPGPVSAIVMKLLAKTAEERYQTAAGAAGDLRRCLDEWETRGGIDEFPLGEHDTPDRLLIPEKLYGRASEIETLLAAFDRIVTGGPPELVLVSGYSGIGKSSVVNELHKVLVPPRSLFASGKFDQYKRDIPYVTIAEAFQSLVRPLLGRSEAEIGRWRDSLSEALGPNGQLIVNLVPQLELVIGKQPPLAELPPQDAQRRFQMVFRRFLGVFARKEHPLALFLDDLQWLDAATLDLLESVIADVEVRNLLIVGAYRQNEVGPAHPLLRMLESIRNVGGRVQEIALAPLGLDDIGRLVADALHCEPERAHPLARLVHEKTGGNPFFAIHFFTELAEEGLLTFDPVARAWQWKMDRIRAKNYTDNVVEFITGKLKRFSATTQEALKQLACLGNVVDLATLTLVLRETEEAIDAALAEAVHAGVVSQHENAYKFLHDRIQQAAYSLIPEERRAEVHLRIGRLLVANTPVEQREEAIYEIVNQLNHGAPLITSDQEREQLAELNLIAGKRAKASTAYGSALTYLVMGQTLLPGDGWERRYPVAFGMDLARAECEFLTGDLAAAEERLATLSVRASNLVDKAAVACLRAALYTTLARADRAVEICVDYLRWAGIAWSLHPSDEEVHEEYAHLCAQLDSRPIEALFDLPLVSDSHLRATMEVLTELAAPAFFIDGNLHCLALLRIANLSSEHGNCNGSCYAYSFMHAIVGARFGDYRAGLRFGQLSLDLVEKKGLDRFKARVYFACGAAVFPWGRHLRAALPLLRRGLEAALETGDQTYSAYSYCHLVGYRLTSGDPVEEVQREAESALEFAQHTHFAMAADVVSGQLGFIKTMRGLTPQFGSFYDDASDEGRFEQHLEESPSLIWPACWYWVRKLQARFHAGDYGPAVAAAAKARTLLDATTGAFEAGDYHFYAALASAAASDSATPGERREDSAALAEHHRRLTLWAENCPENFANRVALVGAEMARLEGRELDAMRLYEQAIHSARDHGFVQNEALAYEVAARFYAARGFDKIANAYLQDARYGYLRWGANGKVKQLDHLYPHLKNEPAPDPTSTTVAPVEFLDLATVIRVSQAVSGEMVLEKLIERLMRAAIEHAGAERGLLIVPQGDVLQMEAEASISGENVTVHLRDGTPTPAALPESLVRYVMRTQETVMLDDASSLNPFSADPYIDQRRARSILSLPLINQGKLIGILYLENNLTPRVFTPARVTVLKVLASQAAISLENTRLYRDVADREGKIRRLVDANIMGIFIWNLEGAIIGANEAFLGMVQYDREDLLSGRVRWTDLTPAEWRERDERAVTELKGTGTVQPHEREYFRKDGSRVPVLVGGAVFQEGGNEGVAFVLDLSEQKRAEEALRRSESYLAEAQRLSHTGSWAWSPDLTGDFCASPNQDIRYWSEECYRVLSFDAQDGLPRFEDFFQRIHPDDQPGFRELIETAIREKAEWEADYRIVHPDGAIREIHVVGHPVLSASGHLVEFVGTVIDVTERKRAEEERRRSEMELRQIVDLVPQLIAVYGTTFERFYANRTTLDYLGVSLDEWQQKTFAHSTHPDDLERLKTSTDRALSSGSAYEVELRLRKHDGSYRWFLARYNPVRDDKGQITRWYVTATDIEDRKQAEDTLRRENVVLREEIEKTSMFEEIVGTSPALKAVLSRISKVAPSDSTVLITGETGTGKELVARAIHRRSNRAPRAFVSVNCAAIPRDLIASELFGHERGAFTGATQQRVGRFELANGGTLFLDEVGELPAETQIALLRVLQEHEFERVGGIRKIHADVRVIAATNRDLQSAISAGSFRSDLFYRLNVFPIEIPALRERKEDIRLLVEYFIDRYTRKAGKKITTVDKKTIRLLESYPWPGNIRELQNVIERSVIVCETENFSVDESWLSQQPPGRRAESHLYLSEKVAAQEKEIIEAALRECRGRVFGPSGAAAKLGIARSTLESKIQSLKINKNRFKT
jgi:PAS domain S-box-containing protein